MRRVVNVGEESMDEAFPTTEARVRRYYSLVDRGEITELVQLFTQDAVDLIYDASRGIPRTISVICDNSLVAGFATGENPIGRDIVLEVCNDFDLVPEPKVEFTKLPIRPDPPADSDMSRLRMLTAKPTSEQAAAAPRAPATRDLFQAFRGHR